MPLFFAATFSVFNFYMVCQRELYPDDWKTRLKYLPFADGDRHRPVRQQHPRGARGAARQAERVRPHAEVRHRARRATSGSGKKYHQIDAGQPLIELALGLYFTGTVFYALANGIYGTLPFLVLFQVGFLYTGLLSIVQQFGGDDMVLRDAGARRESRPRRARGRRRDVVGDLLPRRRPRRAVLLRLRHPRPRAARDVRGGLLPAVASAGCRRAPSSATCSRSSPRRGPLPEPIIRLMQQLPPADGMDALRTLTSALAHYDPDAADNSPRRQLPQGRAADRRRSAPGRDWGRIAGRAAARSRPIRRWATPRTSSTC